MFQPNEKPQFFIYGKDTIRVDVENSLRGLFWRMRVNGKDSKVYSHYQGMLIHEGYGLVTAYWGEPKEFIPFKIVYAEKAEV